jgi:hypothetical protein
MLTQNPKDTGFISISYRFPFNTGAYCTRHTPCIWNPHQNWLFPVIHKIISDRNILAHINWDRVTKRNYMKLPHVMLQVIKPLPTSHTHAIFFKDFLGRGVPLLYIAQPIIIFFRQLLYPNILSNVFCVYVFYFVLIIFPVISSHLPF